MVLVADTVRLIFAGSLVNALAVISSLFARGANALDRACISLVN